MPARLIALLVLLAVAVRGLHGAEPDPQDWPMYNYDLRGTRHNVGERTLGADNVARLAEKWRFPAKDSEEQVGVIHGTPVVVDGAAGCQWISPVHDDRYCNASKGQEE